MRLLTVYWIVLVLASVSALVNQNRRNKKGQSGIRKAFNPANRLKQWKKQVKNNKKGNNGHAKWDYGDRENGTFVFSYDKGPEFWQELFPTRCGGLYQSPIDIATEETVYQPRLKEFTFSSPAPRSKFIVYCNGHSVQVNTKGDFYVHGGGLQNVYKTEQFHFHWGDNSQYGSEHTIDGLEYPIELHIVNWNSKKYASFEQAAKHRGGIAVLAVLFETSRYDNPVLEKIIRDIPNVRDPDLNKRVQTNAMSMRNLLPRRANRYYRYHGSLTTPTCLQSVIWTVFERKLPISERQLNVFRKVLKHKNHGNTPSVHGRGFAIPEEPGTMTHGREVLVNNYRPVQPLNGRTVYRSFPYFSSEL